MKFSILSDRWLPSLRMAARFTGPKCTLPVLHCLRLSADDRRNLASYIQGMR